MTVKEWRYYSKEGGRKWEIEYTNRGKFPTPGNWTRVECQSKSNHFIPVQGIQPARVGLWEPKMMPSTLELPEHTTTLFRSLAGEKSAGDEGGQQQQHQGTQISRGPWPWRGMVTWCANNQCFCLGPLYLWLPPNYLLQAFNLRQVIWVRKTFCSRFNICCFTYSWVMSTEIYVTEVHNKDGQASSRNRWIQPVSSISPSKRLWSCCLVKIQQ